MSPSFTVVIPAYNSERFIAKAIGSALAQTHAPLEVIVVDDGSQDGTGRIVQEFGPPVRYHKQANSGPSAARNQGVSLAQNEWIAFLDSDDAWLPEKLARQAELIQQDPSLALVAAHYAEYDGQGSFISESGLPQPLTAKAVMSRLTMGTLFLLSSTVVRRAVFQELQGFNPGLVCGEDREFWARLASRYSVGAVHEVLVRKLHRPDSLSADPRQTLQDGLVVNRLVDSILSKQFPPWHPMRHLAHQRANSHLLWSVAWLHAQRGERRQALSAVLQSLVGWPFPYRRMLRRKLLLLKQTMLGQTARPTTP